MEAPLLTCIFVTFLAVASHRAFSLSSVVVAEDVELYPKESISAEVEAVAVESRLEVVVEEITVQKEDEGLPEQTIPQLKISQPAIERDDDSFVRLDVVPGEAVYLPPGTYI